MRATRAKGTPMAGFRILVVTALGAALFASLAPGPPAHAAQTRAIAVATDFSSATIGSVDFGPPRTPHANQAGVCSDAVLRWRQGLVYVVERFGCDAIRILDGSNGFALVRQFSVGNGTNPNDIAVVSPTKAYVACYDSPNLLIVNPSSGLVTGAISLAAFADHDGIPEMNRLAVRNGRLFVSVQRVDRDQFFSPTDSSALAVIDLATDQLVDVNPDPAGVQGILLPAQNPTTEIEIDANGDLLVGCTGFFGANDGGVARIDPVALVSKGLETTEAQLGGDVNDIAVASAVRGFAVLSDANFDTKCVAYDRATGAVTCPVHTSSGFTLADAEVNDRGELWLCDRTPQNPGLRVFSATTCAALAGPISIGLPPVDVTFDANQTVDVGDPFAGEGCSAGRWAVASVAPQPFVSRATVRLARAPRAAGAGAAAVATATTSAPAPRRLTIFDASGRRVRALEALATAPADAAATEDFVWDGRDERGRPVAAGVYPFQFEADGERVAGRLVRLEGGRP
jgi:hypothetical protein